MAERNTDADNASARRGSIELLYAAQETALLGYARRLVNDENAAQDIVQEAFLKLHPEFESVRNPKAWLYRTTHNLARNYLRAGRRIVPLGGGPQEEPEVADAILLPDEQIERMERIGQTRLCLEGLDSRSQELLRLKFDEGLSYKEISATMDLSVGNVGYLLHHALKDLAAALKKNGVIS